MSKKVNRNDPCPCGSGKKYKQCCLKNETVKTYTPSGKRKFKAKLLSSTTANLFGKLSRPQSKEDFEPTDQNFEKPVEEKGSIEAPLKTPRFKKMPSKKPGDTFKSTDHDFRVDEK